MFVRSTRFETPPENLDSARTLYEQQLLPAIRKLAGFQGAILAGDRITGKGVSTTFWDTRKALRNSEPDAATLRTQATRAVGTRMVEVDRFELVLQERSGPTRTNTFVRINYAQSVPEKLNDAVQVCRESMPLLRQQSGFIALMMGVNRETGRFCVASVWETAAAREASDAVIRGTRQRTAQAGGAENVAYELYEVLFAEIRQAATATKR